jgi:alkanesulfonate monooxygenase SsuD/methylene tetrahydromethanopterin reductase-like flavin-dependent oxidoreductase (luciferase family)
MLKYTFAGSKETVKAKTLDFLKRTGVNEVMAVTNIYGHQERVNSYRIFAEIMNEIG